MPSKHKLIEHTCSYCGKTFYRRKENRYAGEYCSRECKTKRDHDEYIKKFNNSYFNLVDFKDKNNVYISCKTCGAITVSTSNFANKLKTCNKCVEDRKHRQEELKQIESYLKHIDKLKRQLTKKFIEICRKDRLDRIRKEQTRKNKRAQEKLYELRRQDRINSHGEIDKDIELSRLYKRDNGICYLCGLPCNYEDYYISDNGAFIVGRDYPSIDHVIPLSKGGTHTWDNVKLAHFRCNTLKRDNLIPP